MLLVRYHDAMQDTGPDAKREYVWDYPRPPRLEPSDRVVKVQFNGHVLAESRRALRLLETSHPPTWYIPPADVAVAFLSPSTKRSFCEYKGVASYWDLRDGAEVSIAAAWSYASPSEPYEALRDHLAFYPGRVEACFVDGERVQSQDGDFYGGWITSDIRGPFKGGPGSAGW
jgi:uncharacterized protein (DUF427 family)